MNRFKALSSLVMMLVLSAVAAAAEVPANLVGTPRGLIVRVGGGEPAEAVGWAKTGEALVQDLVADRAAADRLHAAAREAGVSGLADAVIWDAGESEGRLPYTDNLVDLLIVPRAGTVAEGEIERVLVPGTGRVLIFTAGQWKSVFKPMPERYDEWPQYDYDAARTQISHDGAIGVPTGLQWKAGRDRSLGKSGSSGVRVAAGRLLHHADAGKEDEVVSRNAFNGLPQWRFENRFVSSDFAPLIAGEDVAYALLGEGESLAALDPATGKVLHRYTQGGTSEQTGNRQHTFQAMRADNRIIIANQGKLVVADAHSDETIWQKEAPGEFWNTPLVAEPEGLVVVVLSKAARGVGRWPGASSVDAIVAFDLATGEERWRNTDVANATVSSIAYANGVVGYFQAIGISAAGGAAKNPEKVGAIDAATGKLIWNKGYPEQLTAQVLMMRGTDLVVGEGGGYWAWDQRTGEQTSQWKNDSNVNCSRIRGTDDWLIFSSTTFLSPDGNAYRRWITRSVCATGAWPAYGMTYFVPNGCHCFTQVSGYLGLHSRTIPEPVADDARLTIFQRVGSSPSAGVAAAGAAHTGAVDGPARMGAGMWLQWNANPRRERSVEGTLGDVEPAWRTVVAAPATLDSPITQDWQRTQEPLPLLTQPVSDGKTVIVAAPYEHAVIALDAATGRERWRWHAGGVVDSTPPIHEGTTIVGSRDGYVTCLDLADGREIWRFLAAPLDERIVVDGQVESRWPMLGAVLIHEGSAWVSAGRHPELAHGITVYRLDPASGKIQWKYQNTGHPESLAPRKPGEDWPDGLRAGENMRQQHNLRQGMMAVFGPPDLGWIGLSGLAIDPDAIGSRDKSPLLTMRHREIYTTGLSANKKTGELEPDDRIRYRVAAWYRGDEVQPHNVDARVVPRYWPFRLAGFPSDHGHSMGKFLDDGGRELVEREELTATAIARGDGGWFVIDGERDKVRARGPQASYWPDSTGEKMQLNSSPKWKTSLGDYREYQPEAVARCGDRLVTAVAGIANRPRSQPVKGGLIHILDASTGERLAEFDVEGRPIRGALAAMPGLILVADEKGGVSAYRAK